MLTSLYKGAFEEAFNHLSTCVRHVQAANRKKLAVAGATGSKVVKLNIAMQYLTENSRFAGKLLKTSAQSSNMLHTLPCCQILLKVWTLTPLHHIEGGHVVQTSMSWSLPG